MSLFRYRNGSVHCRRRGMLLARARQPAGFAARARGLLGMPPLEADEALWFERCSAIHMFGMRRAIDVVFLAGGEVVRLCPRVLPFTARGCHRADTSLELAVGQIQRLDLAAGDQLEFVHVSN